MRPAVAMTIVALSVFIAMAVNADTRPSGSGFSASVFVQGNPNNRVVESKGTLGVDRVSGSLYQNTNGQKAWTLLALVGGAGDITAVTTAATSGLTGGATSGAVALTMRADCAGDQELYWTGSAGSPANSWECRTGGTVTLLSTLTTNAVPRASGAAQLRNSAITDDGVTTTVTGTANQFALTVVNPQTGLAGDAHGTTSVLSGTLNATAANRSAVAIRGDASSSRSAGANTVTNYGGFFNAASGQVNYALYTDLGDVVLNGGGGTTTITTSASGANATGPLISNVAASGTVATLFPSKAGSAGIGSTGAGVGSFVAASTEIGRWSLASGMHSPNTSGWMAVTAAASSTAPTLVVNRAAATTGWGAQASGNISAIVSATEICRFDSSGLRASSTTGYNLIPGGASATTASVVPNRGGGTTGMGGDGSNVSLIVGGVERVRVSSTTLNVAAGVSIGATAGTGPTWASGTGTPEGAVTAPIGSLFSRTDGGASTTLYVKESGAGNTGWVAK